MDHLSYGGEDEDSAIVPRARGQLNFRKVKRTRMNVDHLTDEEKRLRKRFLGRERARRYRERKRATESSPEELIDTSGFQKAPPKPRCVGRPKGSRTKKKRLILLTPQSKKFERGAKEGKSSSVLFLRHSSLSTSSTKEAVKQSNSEDATCSLTVQDPGTSVTSLIVKNSAPPTKAHVSTGAKSAVAKTGVIVTVGNSLQGDVTLIRDGSVENYLNKQDAKGESMSEGPVFLDDQNDCQLHVYREIEASVNEMDLQAGQGHSGESLPTFEEPRASDGTENSLADGKVLSADLKNLSTNCGLKRQTETRIRRRRRRFRQQNVKDFINFFPIDDLGTIDAKSFVTGSCSMQRQVECVPSVKRLNALKQSGCETTSKMASSTESVNSEGLSYPNQMRDTKENAVKLLEPVKSKDTTEDSSPREKIVEKPPTVSPVESVLTQPTGPISETPIHPALPVSSLPVVYESTSAQPFTMLGLKLPQTLQDVQISGLLQQQQLINAAASIQHVQGLNTLDVGSPSNIVSVPKLSENKGAPSLQGTDGLSTLEGVAGVQGLSGVQGIVGNSALQGLQGVTDPRLLPLAGLQGVGGLQNIASLQGVLGGFQGLTGLQGVTNLQGFGCLPGPTSPAALVGLQGFPGLQAVQGLQGIPSLQPVTGLQGLVSLPGVAGLTGIQGLQGVGLAGMQSAQGLQAVAALQGSAYLQGAPGLMLGLPNQAGASGQQESLASTSAAAQEDTACQEGGTGQGVKADGDQKMRADQKKGQLCESGIESIEDQSQSQVLVLGSKDTAAVASTPEKVHQPQKGRSRRKQASPRCITKQLGSSSDSRLDTDDEENYTLFTEDSLPDDSSQSGSSLFSCRISPESLTLDAGTGSTPQKDASSRSASKATMESPRPGAKLSKKVEELMSATKPHRSLDIDCSSADPVDEESPSPQTWRRFLEREKQRNDRLREVEEQLAHLQAHAARCRALGPKSFVSTATQTDPEGLFVHQDGGSSQALHGGANPGQIVQNTRTSADAGQAEGSRVTNGQIQQGVVTSSGDSLIVNSSPEANVNEDEVSDTVPSLTEGISEIPPQAHQDTEAKIMNRPSNIWLHSSKRKRKTLRRSVRSLMSTLAEGSGNEPSHRLNQEETETGGSLKSPLSLSPQRKTAKYVFQIPLEEFDSGDNTVQLDKVCGSLSESRPDNSLETSLAVSVGGLVPTVNPPKDSKAELIIQPSSVLPWEVEGLSKIERNRIRAREGMRRHREKLRQAKLAAQTLQSHSVASEGQVYSEASPVIWGSGTSAAPCSVPVKMPDAFNSGKSVRGGEVFEGLARGSQLQLTPQHGLANAETLRGESSLVGQNLGKKPFDILAQVAVKIEPTENTDQESTDVPHALITEDLNANARSFTVCGSAAAQISDSQGRETTASLEISNIMPVDHAAGNPMSSARIDFTQEPYRSMSLRDRNRIRAREGMRRYRERMRLARLMLPQPSKVAFAQPCSRRGPRKGSRRKASHRSGKDCDGVLASSHLAELAKRHAKGSTSLPSYSEMVEYDKVEAMKRKRAFALLRTKARGPKAKLDGKHLSQALVIESSGLQDAVSSACGAGSFKSGHIALAPNELILDSGSESINPGPKPGDFNLTPTRLKRQPPAQLSTVLPEELGGVQNKSLKSEEPVENHSDLTLDVYIQEKMLCGMDKYAAISMSAAAQKHAVDFSVATQHLTVAGETPGEQSSAEENL
ncbi:uncharacterized protein LOC110973024 isoform X2 [Acanthaster planci]|uniref:Uncharacterized protein LOC110973024 isoform X2 n=1 Tax=Acanthaster planci TaxID=133434 RepID=A0A8B7XFS6_ACAPL|nr:uncharacterized protein LOC110973024 isoform X2 [Acanthaster planci]